MLPRQNLLPAAAHPQRLHSNSCFCFHTLHPPPSIVRTLALAPSTKAISKIMSDTNEEAKGAEGGSEPITIRIRDQVSKQLMEQQPNATTIALIRFHDLAVIVLQATQQHGSRSE